MINPIQRPLIKSILFLIIAVVCISLSHHRESATAVKSRSESAFSAEDAMDHLRVIAAEAHPIGSVANHKVRDYLVGELTALGLETSVDAGHVKISWGEDYTKSAYVENVIATLPGSDPSGKKVTLAAHYDSVFEGPGAADDGYAVASMIQTVKLLKDQPRKNDIQLLITDGEEMGLLGAYFHVKKYPMDDIGVLLNYEARGNEGPGIAFEWSEDNAWLVREMKKSAARPIANSLSFEIYNLMRNSSDFTAFKKRDVPGINHAFIDGFSYYHNPQDNVDNISMESFQHTGENMYLMTRHFANHDFADEGPGNASFFNFYGTLLVYPSSIDLILIILLVLLYIGLMVLLHKRNKGLSPRLFFPSYLLMLFYLLLILLANFGLATLIKKIYPQYATFYSYQYYNHEWYLISGIGLSLLLLALLSSKFTHKNLDHVTGMQVLTLLATLSGLLYFFMPTGTYVMLLPSLALASYMLVKLLTGRTEEGWVGPMIFILFLAGMWTFLTHGLYLAFSISALPGAVLFTILASYVSMHMTPSIWKGAGRKAIAVFGLTLMMGSMVIAHLKTQPTEKEPLLTNLAHVFDSESGKSYLATVDDHLHEGHGLLHEEATASRLPRHLNYTTYHREHPVDLETYQSTTTPGHLGAGNFEYTVINPKRASLAHVKIHDTSNLDSLYLNEKFIKRIGGIGPKNFLTTLYGYGLDTLRVRVVPKDSSQTIKVHVNMEYSGLAEALSLPSGQAFNDPITYINHALVMGQKY